MTTETIEPTPELIARRRGLSRRAEFLPGFDLYVAEHPDIGKYITEQWRLLEAAIRDDDLVRFEDASGGWLKACHRVNELLAEAYRQQTPDPEQWELRYVKWMKLVFIRCESPLGEFYIVPRRPRRRPKAKHWYTADEAQIFALPATAGLVALSGQLPLRPEDLPRPKADEKHLHLDFTGPTPQTYFDLGGKRWKNGAS